MGHNRGPACRVADQPSTRCLHVRTHVHADTRFMYLCTAAARLKGIWLHGVRGRGEGEGGCLFCRQRPMGCWAGGGVGDR